MLRLRVPLSLVFASLSLVLAAPTATELPVGVTRGASVEGITEYQLANGLKVLLFPDPGKQTITVNVTYLVGSRHEGYGETGMAHLLEHLVFKGTPGHTNIPQELTAHGARPNGTTSTDRTNYFETFAATDENLEWALDLEADRMVNSFIAKKDLDSEMTVVRNEFEAGENSPQAVLQERILSTAFLWHNYGNSTIGARADIENVPIERLQAFYRNYYQPDNAVLLVAGKFDVGKTLGLIAQKFGRIPRPTRVLVPTYTLDPTQDGERSVTLRRVGDTQAVGVVYHMPAGTHPDAPALDLLAYVLGDTPSGRLYKALVETKKAAFVYAYAGSDREPGVIGAGASVRLENALDEARDILVATLEGIAANPPTDEEVNRARSARLKNIDLALKDPNRVGLQLSEYVALGDWRLYFLNRDRLAKVTTADVKRVAGQYLKPSNRTVGLFIPTKEPDRAEIPAAPDVAALVKDYKGNAQLELGEAFDPSPANLDHRAQWAELAPGFKVGMLPKKTRGNAVQVSLSLGLGSESALKGRSTAGDLAGSMLMRGTKSKSRQQIQDEIDRLKARIGVGGGATGAFASIECERAQLAAALKLVAEILREPSFPSGEFELIKQQQLTALEEARSEPSTQASVALRKHLSPYPKDDVRYVSSIDESVADVNAATLEQVKKFYTDFYGASDLQIGIAGDFDPGEFKGLAKQLFAGWKSASPFKRIPAKVLQNQPLVSAIETPDKANAVLLVGLPLAIRDDNPDYPALVLGSFMTGGGFLNSRLAVRIRQKEGLSYSVGAGFSAGSLDEVGSFSGNAIYAPQNADKVLAAYREEIQKVVESGFTAEEVAAAKSGWLQGRTVARSADRAVAGSLARYAYLGRRFAWDGELEKKVAGLTAEQVHAAMKKWIDPARISYVRAGDFAGAAQAPISR